MKPDFFGQRFCTKGSKGDVGLWVFLVVYILFGGKIPNVSPERLWFLFKGQTWGANKRIRSEPCFFRIFELSGGLIGGWNHHAILICFRVFSGFVFFCGSLAVVYNLYVACNIPCQVVPRTQQTMPGPLFSGMGRGPSAFQRRRFEPLTATWFSKSLLDLFVSKKHRS